MKRSNDTFSRSSISLNRSALRVATSIVGSLSSPAAATAFFFAMVVFGFVPFFLTTVICGGDETGLFGFGFLAEFLTDFLTVFFAAGFFAAFLAFLATFFAFFTATLDFFARFFVA